VSGAPTGSPPGAPDRLSATHSSRSGAHRPRRPVWHDLLPLTVIALAVVALAIGIFELKDSVLGGTSGATTGNGPVDDPNGPAANPTGSATQTAPASPSPTSTASATSAVVSHSVKVSIFNATSRSGLAKGATTKLSDAGWTHATTGGNKTYSGATTVFYPTAGLKATAKAVAQDLGGYAVEQSSAYGSAGLTVLLGSDYNP
jgi:LytR cell envelope-related transcriptional attenuator